MCWLHESDKTGKSKRAHDPERNSSEGWELRGNIVKSKPAIRRMEQQGNRHPPGARSILWAEGIKKGFP